MSRIATGTTPPPRSYIKYFSDEDTVARRIARQAWWMGFLAIAWNIYHLYAHHGWRLRING